MTSNATALPCWINPFDDARLLYERALKHIAEYVALPSPWAIDLSKDPQNGWAIYTLKLNREILRQSKPVIGDVANNLRHALDHVTSAAARLNGAKRDFKLKYPIHEGNKEFVEAVKKIEGRVGVAQARLMERLWAKNWHSQVHLEIARLISNDAKHWELSPHTATAHGVGWTLPGDQQQTHAQVPAGHFDQHDDLVFLRSQAPLPPQVAFQTVISLTMKGLQSSIVPTPWSLIGVVPPLVLEIIQESERLAGWPPF